MTENLALAIAPARPTVLLCGNPNSGKTTLFNAMSGGRARVANYPGVTVDRRSAELRLPSKTAVELVDLPGTYSLTARSPEERIAAEAIWGHLGRKPDVVVAVVDATTLGRGLYLALQIAESEVPMIVALNMMDEARDQGIQVDVDKLSQALRVPVLPIVARRNEGLDHLRSAIDQALRDPTATSQPLARFPAEAERDIEELAAVLRARESITETASRAQAAWCLLSLDGDELEVSNELRDKTQSIRKRAEDSGRDLDAEIVSSRYAFVDQAVARVQRVDAPPSRLTDRIDAVLTHPVSGLFAFVFVMLVVFEALFAWSDPAIGLIEEAVAFLQTTVASSMTAGTFRDLLVDGVIAGVGNVLVFVPQIALLFLLVGILEDSGYLARVAFVIDRVMSGVGLHGRAFVPLLSGFACAIPAVMATRTIENRKDRLVTMLALPMMSCSARLPVYVIVVATVFAGTGPVLGILNAGSVALLCMYLLSVGATLGAAAVLRRTVLRGPKPALVLELPPYRMPLVRNLLLSTWQRLRSFLVDAGTIILALTIVLWALLSFPKDETTLSHYEDLRAQAHDTLEGSAQTARLEELAVAEESDLLQGSAAGQLGRTIEPVLEPLGFDWRLGIGILGAFAAREVFVSTLGMVFGIGEADEESEPLRRALSNATRADGSPLLTPLSGVSLMVFFVLACQCMSTIAVVRRESGSWKWPLLMFTYMSVLAYVSSLLVYQGGLALGLGP